MSADPLSGGPEPSGPEPSSPEPGGPQPADLAVDFASIKNLIDANLRPRGSAPPAVPQPDGTAEQLSELADDMLDLLRRVTGLEGGQVEVLARLDRIEQSARSGFRDQVRETDQLRRDLLGEHRALAARVTVEAIFPVLDKLHPMRAVITPRKNEALANQLDAILEILGGLIRALGYTPFAPAAGEAFDPHRMQCVGFKKGPPGVVLGVVQPGYAAGATVLRPAGVLLAPPP